MGQLSDLRQGIPEHKIVFFPGTEIKLALVQLSTKEIIQARQEAMEYISENVVDTDTGDLIFNTFTLLKAMKEHEDLEKSFADSYEEIQENTTPLQIYELHNQFLEVQNGKSSDLVDMTDEEFSEIKKKLETIQLNELDGELQNVLRYFHQKMLLKDLQKGN